MATYGTVGSTVEYPTQPSLTDTALRQAVELCLVGTLLLNLLTNCSKERGGGEEGEREGRKERGRGGRRREGGREGGRE